MTIVETIRDLHEKATPGPLYVDSAIEGGGTVLMSKELGLRVAFFRDTDYRNAETDAELHAALHNAAAALLRVVEAARACYEEDDFITVAEEGDGRHERDRELGEALEALVRA